MPWPLGRVLAITTMNAAGYAETGRAMLESAERFWSPDIRLRCYAEGFAAPSNHPRVEWLDLLTEALWLEGFRLVCEVEPIRRGITAGGGYDFRFDARKFSHKVAALTAAARDVCALPPRDRPELLAWMDADTLTHAPVDAAWLSSLLPGGALLAWLDRRTLYPECGFLLFDPGHPAFVRWVVDLLELYQSGKLFGLREWHDSYAIQCVTGRLVAEAGIRVASLSGDARDHSHPAANGPISERFDHLKGPNRKRLGRTPARERTMRDDGNPYWRR